MTAVCFLLWAASLSARQTSRSFAPYQSESPPPEPAYVAPYPLDPSVVPKSCTLMLELRDSSGAVRIYALSWPAGELKNVATLRPPRGTSIKGIQATPDGRAVYIVTREFNDEAVVVWDGKQGVTFPSRFRREASGGGNYTEREKIPGYLLSPDGSRVVFFENNWIAVVDSSHGILVDEFALTRLEVGDSIMAAVRSDTVMIDGYDADAGFLREAREWSHDNPDEVYVNDYYLGQLVSEYHMLWRLNVRTGEYRLVDRDAEQFCSASYDGAAVLYTNNDQTCCAGINYTDNQVVLYDAAQNKRFVVYDEFRSFKNENKAEEHTPVRAECSPDLRRVAVAISGYSEKNRTNIEASDLPPGVPESLSQDRAALIRSLEGGVETVFRDREFLGWLDSDHILVRPYAAVWKNQQGGAATPHWEETTGTPRVIDVRSGSEHELLREPMSLIGIVRQ